MDSATGAVIAWELLAIGITSLGALGVIIYQVGRRSKDLDVLAKAQVAAAGEMSEHDKRCRKTEKRRLKWERKVEKRLGLGSKHMALLDERYQSMHADVKAIRKIVLKEEN